MSPLEKKFPPFVKHNVAGSQWLNFGGTCRSRMIHQHLWGHTNQTVPTNFTSSQLSNETIALGDPVFNLPWFYWTLSLPPQPCPLFSLVPAPFSLQSSLEQYMARFLASPRATDQTFGMLQFIVYGLFETNFEDFPVGILQCPNNPNRCCTNPLLVTELVRTSKTASEMASHYSLKCSSKMMKHPATFNSFQWVNLNESPPEERWLAVDCTQSTLVCSNLRCVYTHAIIGKAAKAFSSKTTQGQSEMELERK